MGREGGREGDGHFAVKETDTKWEWVSGEREREGANVRRLVHNAGSRSPFRASKKR